MSDYVQIYLDADGEILHVYHDSRPVNHQVIEDDRVVDVKEFFLDSDEDDPARPGRKKILDAEKVIKEIRWDRRNQTILATRRGFIKDVRPSEAAERSIRKHRERRPKK